jgi:hypothetical protein
MFIQEQVSQGSHFLKVGTRFQELEVALLNHVALVTAFFNSNKKELKCLA